MNLLTELLKIYESDTSGLVLGVFKLDVDRGVITTKVGDKFYEFTPHTKNVAELYSSVTGIAKHSTDRALSYLKQHATGVPVTEDIELTGELMREHLKDQASYDDLDKFEAAVSKHALSKKLKSWEVTIVSGYQIYHFKRHYFAAWNPKNGVGIIYPDFKGEAFNLIAQVERED